MKTKYLMRITFSLFAVLCGLFFCPWAAYSQGSVVFVPIGSNYKFRDNGSDQGTAWRSPSFDDSGWSSGLAPLGYGFNGLGTTVSYGPDPANKYITTYFRHAFTTPANLSVSNLLVRFRRDDGGIVYLNGVEVFRSNMPNGPVNYLTLAASETLPPDDTNYFSSFLISSALLAPAGGNNVLAAEVHQVSPTSSDLVACEELTGNAPVPNSFTVQVSTAWSTIANNFNRGGNTLNEVLPQVADGTEIYKWNPATLTYSYAFFDANLGGWFDANFNPATLTLAPGEGAWINSPGPQSLTFMGTVAIVGYVNRPLPGPRFVGGRQPMASTFEDVNGFAPIPGDRVLFYDGAFSSIPSQPTSTHVFNNGMWHPALPLLLPGKAMFVDLMPANNCLDFDCPSNVVVTMPCGSSCVSFSNYPPAFATNFCNPADLTVQYSPPTSHCFGPGTTPVTMLISGSGQSNSCQFSVTVLANSNCPPTNHPPCLDYDCPTNVVVTMPCGSSCVSFSNYPPSFATNFCNPADLTVRYSPSAGHCFGLGTTPVTMWVSGSGQSNSCDFSVTVLANSNCTNDCSTNHLINGSFEQPGVPDGYVALPGGDPTIAGWKTVLHGVEYYNPVVAPSFVNTGFAADGVYLLDLAPANTLGGGIEQTFTTIPDRPYHVSFALGTSKERGRNGTASLTVTVAGTTYPFNTGTENPGIVWVRKEFTFRTPLTSATLAFTSTDDPALSFVNLDDVRVSDCCTNPGLRITPTGNGMVVIEWSCGILQSASEATGPFTDVPGATSPYTWPTTGPRSFWRVRVN